MQFHLTTDCFGFADYWNWVAGLEAALFAFAFVYLLVQWFKLLSLKRRIRGIGHGRPIDFIEGGSRGYRFDNWKMGRPLVVLSWISVLIAIGMAIYTVVWRFPELDYFGIDLNFYYREGFVFYCFLYCALAMLTAVCALSAWFVRRKMSGVFDRGNDLSKEREV